MSKSGLASAISSALAPQKMDIVPLSAPTDIPATGASMTRTLLSRCFATNCAVSGTEVDISIHIEPGFIAAATPPATMHPSIACGVGSIVISTSAPVTHSTALAAPFAPAAIGFCMDSVFRSKTVISTPAAARLRDILPPILPVPMNATFTLAPFNCSY